MNFDGKEYIIARGKKYSPQMNKSDNFLPKSFVEDIYHNPNSRIFVPDGRPLDTELLGLEYFAKSKNVVKGKKYPKITGKVKIASDLCPCSSCCLKFLSSGVTLIFSAKLIVTKVV